MCAYPDELKRAKQNYKPKGGVVTLLKSTNQTIMTSERERNQIVQEVLDRLLYLSDAELSAYKRQLELTHKAFAVGVETINGVRIYSLIKNQK